MVRQSFILHSVALDISSTPVGTIHSDLSVIDYIPYALSPFLWLFCNCQFISSSVLQNEGQILNLERLLFKGTYVLICDVILKSQK